MAAVLLLKVCPKCASDQGSFELPRPLSLRYPPLVSIEVAEPVTWKFLRAQVEARLDKGVSFAVLRQDGPTDRGGYFFHLKREGKDFVFSTFDRTGVCKLSSGEDCAEFVNHVAGLAYSEKMWELSQIVNLRTDAN
jgi:hypothetical protein